MTLAIGLLIIAALAIAGVVFGLVANRLERKLFADPTPKRRKTSSGE